MAIPGVTIRVRGETYEKLLEIARKLQIPIGEALEVLLRDEVEKARRAAEEECKKKIKEAEDRAYSEGYHDGFFEALDCCQKQGIKKARERFQELLEEMEKKMAGGG